MLALLLAIVMIVGVLAACNNGGSTEPKTDDKGGETASASSIAVCIASEPDTIDPALNSAVDGATLLAHLFSGLAKWAQDDKGNLVIVADAAKELVEGVANEDGTVTYTYTLRDGLKWSDGQDVKASDYVFAWKRAVSEELAADYGYMFDVVKGYDEGDLAVEAPDDKTIVVTLKNAVAYWNELLAFPTYFPVREDVVSNEAWATDPATYVCNGLYTLESWDHNSVITLKKNENHPDAAEVTMDTIQFYLSDDANNMLTNFKNGDWLLIDDVPTNEIAALKTEYPDEFYTVGQLGTYYVCWNINEELLPADTALTGAEAEAARSEIRQALSLLIDRNYIIDEIAQGGQLPASSFVAMGLTDADGSQFYENAGHNDGFVGYYDASSEAVESNYEKAVEILKKYYEFDADGKITNFPVLTYLYNTSEAHQAIGEYIQSAFANVGITMNMENQEWATFLNTRKAGDYSVARNGWLGDYNDPISFLDMWTTESGNNDVQFGKGAAADLKIYSLDLTSYGYDTKVENGTWAETYDVLISDVKTCADTEKRYALMHLAEDMLMDTGCLTPIYYYTDQYMLSSKVKGFFSNPLGYKYFMYTTVEG
jgi:oligopeptide transport system substrate-binding protein